MKANDSVIVSGRPPFPALCWGAAGVLAFSLTFPATRLALPAFGPVVTGLGRAVIAAALAGSALLVARAPLPGRSQLMRIAIVSCGVVIGFPLLSALALDHVGAGHAAVLAGLLPAATALAAVARAGERPSWGFWLAAGTMPGWQVIAWALLLAAPVLLPVSVYAVLTDPPRHPGTGAWLGLAYVSAVSMFLGFLAWYRGLAGGGVARVGQLQLAQPVLTVGWAALLLGERVDVATSVVAVAVLATTAATQRSRVRGPAADQDQPTRPALVGRA